MTFYFTPMDTISLSRTVFEIFDFKVFRVWPWPSTSKSYLWSEMFIRLESPYMTSYLTFMDTISLSRTIFEIFDFEVFRVWPWTLTSKGHLGSKKKLKLIYDFLFDFYGHHLSISYCFRDIRLRCFPGLILTFHSCPSLWPSGIGSRLVRNRLWVRFLAVSDIYPMFIEPTITWVPSGFTGYIWLDTKIVLKNL